MPSTSQNASSFLYVTQARLPTRVPTQSLESVVYWYLLSTSSCPSLPFVIPTPTFWLTAGWWLRKQDRCWSDQCYVICYYLAELTPSSPAPVKIVLNWQSWPVCRQIRSHELMVCDCLPLLPVLPRLALPSSSGRQASPSAAPAPFPSTGMPAGGREAGKVICQNADALRCCFKPDCC